MSYRISVHGRVARVTLNAAPLNILTAALQDSLSREIAALNKRDDFNLLVVQSALAHFSAGADVSEHLGREKVSAMLKAAHGLIENLLACPVPTLAAVRGHCLGGALELALACDMLLAAEDAQLGLPEIRLACLPPAALVLAPMKWPAALCAELLTSGATLTGAELAARAGIVAVPVSNWTDRVEALCARYASLSRAALCEATRLLRPGAAERFRAQVGAMESVYLERVLAMDDAAEGVRAFQEKRAPVWNHRLP